MNTSHVSLRRGHHAHFAFDIMNTQHEIQLPNTVSAHTGTMDGRRLNSPPPRWSRRRRQERRHGRHHTQETKYRQTRRHYRRTRQNGMYRRNKTSDSNSGLSDKNLAIAQRILKKGLNKIRQDMNDYDSILQHIADTYKRTVFETIDTCEHALEKEWTLTRSRPERATLNRTRMIVMVLLITYQLNILTKGHAPGIAMNWKSMWKYIKKQSILTKLNTDTLTPYWLKNRYGKLEGGHATYHH